jgi:hypothetical protein
MAIFDFSLDGEEEKKKKKDRPASLFPEIELPKSPSIFPEMASIDVPKPDKVEISPDREPPWLAEVLEKRKQTPRGREIEERQRLIREQKRAAVGAPQPVLEEPTIKERIAGALETPLRSLSTFAGKLYQGGAHFLRKIEYLGKELHPIMEALPPRVQEEIIKKGILYKVSNNMAGFGEYLEDGGLPPGLAKEIVGALGEAAFTVPELIATGTFLRGAVLPTHGAVSGAMAAEAAGESETLGGIIGGAEGTLMHGILGAVNLLPRVVNRLVAAATFYGTTPGTEEQKLAAALTMAGIAGKGRPKREVIERYRRRAPTKEVLESSRQLAKIESELQELAAREAREQLEPTVLIPVDQSAVPAPGTRPAPTPAGQPAAEAGQTRLIPPPVDLYKPGATVWFQKISKKGRLYGRSKKGKVTRVETEEGPIYRIKPAAGGKSVTRREGEGWKYHNEDFRLRQAGTRPELVTLSAAELAVREKRTRELEKVDEILEMNAERILTPKQVSDWVGYVQTQEIHGKGRQALKLFREHLRTTAFERFGVDRIASVPEITKKVNERLATATEQALETADRFEKFYESAEPLSIGLSLARKKPDKIVLPEGRPRQEWLEFTNKEVQGRWEAAKGAVKDPWQLRLKEKVLEAGRSFFRRYPKLNPRNEADARVADVLRNFENIPHYSQVIGSRAVKGLVGGLSPKQREIFTKVVVLEDITKAVETGEIKGQGRELHFGLKNYNEAQAELNKFRQVVDANPEIQAALNARRNLFNVLKQELVDYELLPKDVLTDERYYHRQTLDNLNRKRAVGAGKRAVKMGKKSFQQERSGAVKDFNTEYLESEFEVLTDAISQLEIAKTLRRLQNQLDLAPQIEAEARSRQMSFNDVLKEKQESFLADHVVWNPNEGLNLFKVFSLPERALNKLLSGTLPVKDAPFREVLALGRKAKWVIPRHIAETLNDVKMYSDRAAVAQLSGRLHNAWKRWQLFNPFSVVKYFINNLSGDLDITIAYNPKILKLARVAEKEVRGFQKGKSPPDMVEAIKLGVLDTGMTEVEIPDVKQKVFQGLIKGDQPNLIQRYWKGAKGFNTWRENILRLAAYKHFKKELESGETLYGASRKKEMDALSTAPLPERAAKLARELIGDYGGISRAGEWIRQRLISFWSFQEINAPRYLRLMKNLAHEGRGSAKNTGRLALTSAGKIGAGTAWRAAKLFTFANLLHGMVQLWNHTMFPEEEAALSSEQAREGHIILGRRDDGTVRTMRFKGALVEALEWIGGENYVHQVTDMIKGKSVAEKVQEVPEVIKDVPESFLSKIITSLRPEPKLLFESLTGRKLFPDPFKPRPIRDTPEHILNAIHLDPVYRLITKRPTTIDREMAKILFYDADPGEGNYYTFRKLLSDYLEDQGEDLPGFIPTRRANALYFYKQSIKRKNTQAAERYFKEYLELGGTHKGIARSIKLAHPLSGIPRRHRLGFVNSLDDDGKLVMQRAIDWWQDTYLAGLKVPAGK